MKRLIKTNELDDLRIRNNINQVKEKMNKLNRELKIERQDLVDVIGVEPTGV